MIYGSGKHYNQIRATPLSPLSITAAGAFFTSLGGVPFLGVTEAQVEYKLSEATLLKNLRVYIAVVGVVTGTASILVRKNGVDTTLKIDLTSGSSTGWNEDTTHSVSFVAGDKVSISLVGATVGAAQITTILLDQICG